MGRRGAGDTGIIRASGMPEERILGFHDPRREAEPGRLDIGATHYPEGGPYDSRDPGRIRAQFAMAREAGLDGFLVSWWGRESEEALGLDALFGQASEGGSLLAPYYETGGLWPRGAPGVAADIASLLDRHGREPAWLRVGGVPVVFLYASHRLRAPAWDAVVRAWRRGPEAFPRRRRPNPEWLAARPDWLQRFDALHVYTPVVFLARGRDVPRCTGAIVTLARGAGPVLHPAVAPGFDDRSGARARHHRGSGRRRDLRPRLGGGPRGRSDLDPRLELERVARGQRDRAERGARTPISRRDARVGGPVPARSPPLPDPGVGWASAARNASSGGRRGRASRGRATPRRSGGRAARGPGTGGAGAPPPA